MPAGRKKAGSPKKKANSKNSACGSCEQLKIEIDKLRTEIELLKSKAVEITSNDIPAEDISIVRQSVHLITSETQTQEMVMTSETQTEHQTLCCQTDQNISAVSCVGDDTSIQPLSLYPGLPFKDIDIDELNKQTTFSENLGNRSVKYYSEYPYRYGKTSHMPCDIPEGNYLHTVIEKVKEVYPSIEFNSVLVTKYDNGKSFIPFHADNEEMISPNSTIITVSLGASRTIKFQPKKGNDGLHVSVNLAHGSAFTMSHDSQSKYVHGIPQDYSNQMRISITFRQIVPADLNSSPTVSQYLYKLGQSGSCTSDTEDSQTQSGLKVENHKELKSDQTIDSVFISSSMFRHLDEKLLTTENQRSTVLFYPGATAQGIHQKLKTDKRFDSIDTSKVKNIFLLCGTNDVDNILNVGHKFHNSGNVSLEHCDRNQFNKTIGDIEHLTNYLRKWATGATINVINILPRHSSARNFIINNMNSFLVDLCVRSGFQFVNTEHKRCMFSTADGFRKNYLFNVNGSDNVHLTSLGICRLGSYLKYLAHL